MKRIILCILGCILLLMWTSVAAEECTHIHVVDISNLDLCVDLEAGHQEMTLETRVCTDCGKKIIQRSYGPFVGHVFTMAESLHFDEDMAHLFVFICKDCHHIVKEAIGCNRNRCWTYLAPDRIHPQVEYFDHLEAWEAENPEEAIVNRWIARQQDKE